MGRKRRVDNPDPVLLRLVRAAVCLADAIEEPESQDLAKPDIHARFMATDEELREAALAYTRMLSPSDRRRLGRTT